MELKVEKNHFLEAITWTHGITSRRSSIPILSNVLIEASTDNTIRMTTTDLNVWIDVRFPADVVQEGSITVHARTLYEIARSLPENDAIIYSRDQNYRLTVASGRAKYNLNGMPVDDFPQIPGSSSDKCFVLKGGVLGRMIAQTAFSIGHDETRSYVTGAFLQGDGKTIRMVTTDRHRLSKSEYRVEEGEGMYNFEMLIPQRTILELKRMVEREETEIQTSQASGIAFFGHTIPLSDDRQMDVTIISKLIGEAFPPYDRAIPKGYKRKASIPRVPFLDAIRRIAIISEDQTSTVKFSFGEKRVEIESDNPNLGEGKDSVDIHFEGDDIKLSFNAKYFLDVLGVLESDEITMELNEDEDAAVVKDQFQNTSYLGIIMPMKI